MKKILLSVVISLILFSCLQTEFNYSCDTEINRIVEDNKLEFSQISVNELTTYDVILQKAIFRSWDAEKKRTVWIDKLHLIQNTVQLTINESYHIQKLIDHINIGYFEEDKTQEDFNYRDKFAEDWINYALMNLVGLKSS